MVTKSKKCPPHLRAIAELYRDKQEMAPKDSWAKARQELAKIADSGDIHHYDIALQEFRDICAGKKTRSRVKWTSDIS